MKGALLVLASAVIVGCASGARIPRDPLLDSLDRRVEDQQYLEAAVDIYRIPALSPQVLAWLVEKAEAGIPPLQYELSRRTWAADPIGGLRWYARGYVARSLDFSQCSDRGTNPVYLGMLGLYRNLRDKALEAPRAYASAVEEAIMWNERRSSPPSAHWICGNMILPEGQRAREKQSQLEEIRAGIARLRAR
jgi:hypothetical protein